MSTGMDLSNRDVTYIDHAALKDLDSRIVILAAVSLFINAYLCGAVALLAAVYALANPERRVAIMSLPHIRWLTLFACLAFIVPPIYGNWIGLGVGAAIVVVFVFYQYLRTIMNEGLFKAVIDISCMISLVYVLIALFQRVLGLAPRSPSTFQNANYYSYAIELVMVMSFYRLSTAKSLAQKAFIAVVIIANVAGLFMADCRSAWPAIFGGLFVLFVMNRKMVHLLLLIGVYIAGMKLALAFPDIFPRLDTIDVAKFIRTNIWLEALDGIKQYPLFGVGAMGFYHLGNGEFYHAHNLLLETLESFGAVGTVLLGAFFFMTLRDTYRSYKANVNKEICTLVLAAVAVTAVHGLTDVTMMWPQTGILLVLLLSGSGAGRALTPLPSSSPFSA